ncbi:MAG: Ig-like domain-containing protein [Gemmatimonadaceae bacterium]
MRLRLFAFLLLTITCADEGVAPRVVASIVVTSPIGNRLAVGRTVQLIAEARDAGGAAIDEAPVSFTAAPASVAQVTAAGLVSGASDGDVVITATSGAVSQNFSMEVIAADLAAVDATAHEDYLEALVAGMTSAVAGRVNTALTACRSGAASGNFTTMEGCATAIRAEAASATDANDRALLASAALYADHVLRLLDP